MPRQTGTQVENNFSVGLVTEFHSLNYPRNSCHELANVNIDKRGKVTRSPGLDYENGYQQESFTRNNYQVTTYYWKSAGGEADTNLIVVQLGDKIYFYNTQDAGSLSSGCVELAGVPIEIDLDTYKPAGTTLNPANFPCSFADGLGILYICNPAIDPIQVEFNSTTPAVTVTAIDIKVRDIGGVEDNLRIDERPAGGAMTDNHRYNLYNQGWHEAIRESTSVLHAHVLERRWVLQRGGTPNGSGGPTVDPDYWPSNSDVWFRMNSSASVSWIPDFADMWQEDNNSPAPRGTFIIDAFEPDRAAAVVDLVPRSAGNPTEHVSVPNVTNKYTTKLRPKAVAFYAGRVWYAGVDAEGFNASIWFSQVLEDPSYADRCYQTNDPTSGLYPSDLLDSDGGTLTIQEGGSIKALMPFGQSLLIFCSNGVWALSGSDNAGFKATEFNLNRLPGSSELEGVRSLVDANGVPFWWSQDGIYTMVQGDGLTNPQVQNITLDTIDAFYKDIPESEKQYVQGTFDSRSYDIKWIYNSQTCADIDSCHEYDRILKYNVRTKAFTVDHIEDLVSGSPKVISLISVKTQGTIDGSTKLYSNVTKYLTATHDTANTWDVTWSEQSNHNYRHWDTESGSTGAEYDSYFSVGHMVDGEANKKFQSNYITIHTEAITNGSATVQGRWDYTNSGNAGKWTNKQEIYPSTTNRDYQFRKLKIRGQGLALSLRFDSVDRDPFTIVGWSIFETSNAQP